MSLIHKFWIKKTITRGSDFYLCTIFRDLLSKDLSKQLYTNSNNNVVLALSDVSLEENYESGLEESPAGQQFHLYPSIFSYMYARVRLLVVAPKRNGWIQSQNF
jgi:hypothetical protein